MVRIFSFFLCLATLAAHGQDSHLQDPNVMGPSRTDAAKLTAIRNADLRRDETFRKFSLWVQAWAKPAVFRPLLQDPEMKRRLEVTKGEIAVLARTQLLIPPHLIPTLTYKMVDNGENFQLKVYSGEMELGYLSFDREGYSNGGANMGRPALDFLSEEWKIHERRKYKNRTDELHAEMREVLRLTTNTEEEKLHQEGQLEYLAKELFQVRDMSEEVFTTFHYNGSELSSLSFKLKSSNEPIGAVVLPIFP